MKRDIAVSLVLGWVAGVVLAGAVAFGCGGADPDCECGPAEPVPHCFDECSEAPQAASTASVQPAPTGKP